MKKTTLPLFTAFLLAPFFCLAQLLPFPYAIQKEATGDTAMVVSAHPLATKVGLDILKKGGNAIDAAVAMQFALAVVYPQAGNIGGGGFLIYRDAKGKKTLALDYREIAPAAATEKMYLDSAENVIQNKSRLGALACGVPGTVDGMWQAQFYHGRLNWGEVVTPAIELAENGFQITEQEANQLNVEKLTFARHCSLSPAFVKYEGWKAGEWLIQKELAQTLRRIAGDGRDGFYSGATAVLIVKEMEKKGGLITFEDLKAYKSVWRTPLEFDYKDMHVITMPPPSSGGIILRQLLGIVGNYPLKSYGFQSAAAIHLMAEAERRAFADRAEHMADPDFWKVPVKTLTDSAYLISRMVNFKADTVTDNWDVWARRIQESEETTHYSVVDKEGNAVSVTTTLNDRYGSHTVVAGAGFILNNQMDDFSAKPGAPNLYGAVGGKANAIAPCKRPLSSMTPTIVTKGGKNWLVLGTPGGTTIPTSVFQVMVNVSEFGLTLPEAVQAKRFHHQWKPNQISLEEGCLSEEVEAKLRRMGHRINYREPIGRVEAIIRLPNGKWQGVADGRGDDAAGGY
ncbi:MAG: gamma-glutamyltransferase [Saprospiraceae bacterium]|nr:gamma-glutamyltransferase [Saprospiraceae bacterium]